jgi:hypothetical protein
VRLVWLVEDDERTVSEIADELIPTLPDLFYARGVEAVGPLRWHPEPDDYGQSWLVLDVDVRPWTDPVRDRTRRSTTT